MFTMIPSILLSLLSGEDVMVLCLPVIGHGRGQLFTIINPYLMRLNGANYLKVKI